MKLIALLIVVFISGCCSLCPPKIIKESVEVKVPVVVPCKVALPVKPKWELDAPHMSGAGLFNKGNSALKELEQHRQYERELEATITSCTSPPG